MITTDTIIKRPSLYKEYEKGLLTGKAIYICGHTGWGKTTAVLNWLKTARKTYAYLSVGQEDFKEALEKIAEKLIIIDDLHCMTEIQEEQALLHTMISFPDRRFVLIGRAGLPPYLKPFQITGQLSSFEKETLYFDRSMIAELLAAYHIKDPSLPIQIEEATKGYAMGVRVLINRLAQGEPMNEITVRRARQDIFDCYDEILFKKWDVDLQNFLLHMASFDKFTEKMAVMVTGKKDVHKTIHKALTSGSYLTLDPPDTYSVHSVFLRYLRSKQQVECSAEWVKDTWHNAALYYELEDDIPNALKYYQLCGNMGKISELLIQNSNRHPGNGHYVETEKYYRSLPTETILASPELMSGMSMLCSLRYQTEESEYWYTSLEQYKEHLDRQDRNYKLAQGKLSYLKIALPHRGSKNITAILLDAAKAYSTGAFQLQEFSVTSNLPSILNGGKDFCGWVKHDRKFYHLMKKPCELLLGRYGIGLADIALAESLFEKTASDNLTEIILLANAGQNAASFKGTLEMEFAATGILCRIMLLQNNLPASYALLENVKARAEKEKMQGLADNLEALHTWLILADGKTDGAGVWLRNKAPDENKCFQIMDRYRYLVKIRCYLAFNQYTDALLLLGKLADYFIKYDRIYGQLQAGILLAITQYRMGQEGWEVTLNHSLTRCEQYDFIRLVAEEGAALLPLLEKAALSISPQYKEQIIKETRKYALLYPHYLKPLQMLAEPLTDTEKTVLQLLCKGLSNDEIAMLMGVALRTVKFHTGNLYAKMNVKGRLEATKKANILLREI